VIVARPRNRGEGNGGVVHSSGGTKKTAGKPESLPAPLLR
jgi:hypothetical protein